MIYDIFNNKNLCVISDFFIALTFILRAREKGVNRVNQSIFKIMLLCVFNYFAQPSTVVINLGSIICIDIEKRHRDANRIVNFASNTPSVIIQ